ncbi:helix-turn-helix domain-containing protein [Thauera linaloolentis]|nr:helix-turn-helix domain-containing protein [Thauera linaloolentis]MCM8564136.1 helix-turn-helix domain-containing protein [Thauera linaloolentis]
MRQAREQRGESVGEVAFALKLSPRQIAALEANDFAALPGMAFVRGFLRNYARYLGLDPAPLLDDVQRLAGEGAVDLSPIRNADGELPSGSGPHVRAAPIGWLVLALALMLLAGWYFDWFRTEPPAAETELEAPVMGSVPVEPVPPVGVVQEIEAPPPAAVPEAANAVPGEPSAEPAVPSVVAGTDAAPPAAEEPPAPAAEALAEVPAAPAGGGVLAFRFAGESWVEVRDAGGAIIYSGTNRAGSTRNVQGKPPFALVIGNAAGVSLEFDGRPVDLAAHTKVTVARLTVK